MRKLNTEIIAIGTELLLGQIANTNAQWMSQELALIGVNTFHHTVVGDNLHRTVAAFNVAHDRSDVVIVSGGLGPTDDDLTREAFSEMSGIPIVADPEALQKVQDFFANRPDAMPPSNLKQANSFAGAKVIPNPVGIAAGIVVEYEAKIWFFLPGVPREMKRMFTDTIIPYLRDLNGEMIIESKVLNFIGIGESQLEYELQDLIRTQENPTIAPLALNDGVILRLTAKTDSKAEAHKLLDETKAKIVDKIGDYIFGEDEQRIEERITEILQSQNKTIAAAESLTGGLFTNKFISVNGASSVFKGGVVCYDPTVKEKVLHVDKDTLKTFGTVSEPCARALAENVAALLEADIGISFTGVAGPDALEGKPVGTVFISIYDRSGYTETQEFKFVGNRKQIRYRSMLKGFEILFNYLK